MFARYALALGRGAHRHSLEERASAGGLRVLVTTPELLLVAREGTPFLAGTHSILVGQIFGQDHQRLGEMPSALDQASPDMQRALGGYWGNFALFVAGEHGFLVYRDPSANISVYRCGSAGATVFVSDAEVAGSLGLLDGTSPDFQYVAHWLQFPFLRTSRTGIVGVTELLPGQLAASEKKGGWTEHNLWSPAKVLDRASPLSDPEVAARKLCDLARGVLPAQVQQRPVLRLSGGLDSSIIAACFANGGVEFSAVNFSTRSPDGDERDYARAVAQMHGIELIEIGEPEPSGLEIARRRGFAPGANPLLLPFDQAIKPLIGDNDLLVDGGGGDNLFCSLTSAAPLLDALYAMRFRAAAQAASDISERANCTLWDVIGAAARRSARRRRPWKQDRSFLQSRVLVRSPATHPWLLGLNAPPGKREHVEALVHIHHFLDRGQAAARVLHPLLCQPLLELCLRIPTWLWVRGGCDRAVARDAFASMLPATVIARRAKGSLQSMFHRSFERLGSDMLELLRSGKLALSGIIDVGAVERAFTGREWERDEVQLRLSELVAMELWLRSWSSAATSTTAV